MKGKSRKFGAPLFFCAFVEGESQVVLGGGGGASSTGVANRLLLVAAEGGGGSGKEGEGKGKGSPGRGVPRVAQLESDPCGETHTGDAAVVGGAWLPDRSECVCVVSSKEGLRRYRLRSAKAGHAKGFDAVSIPSAHAESFRRAEVKCVAASARGTRIAVGFADGRLSVCDAGTLAQVAERPASDGAASGAAIASVCMSARGDHVVAVRADGTAFLWAVPKAKGAKGATATSPVVPFASPKAAGSRAAYRGCFVCDDANGALSVGLGWNSGGRSHIVRWKLIPKAKPGGGAGAAWHVKRAAMRLAHTSPLTILCGFDPAGAPPSAPNSAGPRAMLGTGSTEGDVGVFDATTLARLHSVPGAHMIFVTHMAFSPTGARVASVSADAGARIDDVSAARRGGGRAALPEWVVQLFIAIVVLLLALRVYEAYYK